MIKMANSNINNPDYKEVEALQQLMDAIGAALNEMNDKCDETNNYNYLDEQFTITVGGTSTAFRLGGPQTQALFDFIECIAEENGYVVDTILGTVTE